MLCVFGGTATSAWAQCPPNVNGLLRGAATVCASANSGKVYVSNPDFTAVEWQYSTDNQTWMTSTGTSDTLTYTNLTQTTHYRASVVYSTCSAVPSNVITITVNPASDAGTITGVTKGCRYTHSGALMLQGYTGAIQNWLVYDTLTKAWNTPGITGSQYNFTNLATETQYKVAVKSGVCPADTSATATVSVYLLPEVDFNDPSDCLGATMQFNENVQKAYESDNQLSTYLWNFDDGTTSTARFPQKTYTNARAYHVSLTATTSKGCSRSLSKVVTVYQNPIANFNTSNACLGDSTKFLDASTSNSGAIAQYNWTFGDMESSTLRNLAHYYAAAQTYTVGLTVTSVYGCSHYTSKSIQVFHNPVAAFTTDSVCLNNATRFTNLSATNDGVLSKFTWAFGDAAMSALQHPTHSYGAAGTFSAKLIVETDKGCSDSVAHEVVVHPLPTVAFDIANACDGVPVRFTNQTTISKGAISDYLWNFGDGFTAAVENPERLYFNAASYNVELLATSAKGCQSRLIKQAIVYKNPIADFSVDNVCLHTPISLVNKSRINNSENLAYHWQLGDGATSGLRDFQHVYAQAGGYPIKLIVTSDAGHCKDSMTSNVLIYALPNIFAGNDVTGSLGYPVQLQATGGVSYHWSPAEGLSATHIPNPLATPKQTTEYTAEGIDINGCINTDAVTVFITESYQIIPTNLVTPDGNGKNDTWVITNIENYPQALVTVFDQHGKEIFSTRNYQNTWDGRNKNGDVLPDGTYYYLITFDSSSRTYKGSITILRNK